MSNIPSPEDWAQWLYDWTGTRVAGVTMLAKRIRARDEAIAAKATSEALMWASNRAEELGATAVCEAIWKELDGR